MVRARPVARLVVRLREARGDAAGWALVTAMTVALVLVVWAIAEEQISVIVREAFAQFGER
jgi:hypothetical protein